MNKSMIYQSLDMKFEQINRGEHVDFTPEELVVLGEIFRSRRQDDDVSSLLLDGDLEQRIGLVKDSETLDGYCYTSAIRMLPSLRSGGLENFRAAVQEFKDGLGRNPLGSEILVNLCLLDKVLQGELGIQALRPVTGDLEGFAAVLLEDSQHIQTVSKMSASKCRYNYEERGGLVHIKYETTCSCTDILCEHGWAARFILQVIAREGRRIGGTRDTVDLSQLFVRQEEQRTEDSIQNTPASAYLPKRNWNHRETRQDDLSEQSMRQQVSEEIARLLGETLNARTEVLEDTMERILGEKRKSLKAHQCGSSDYSQASGSEMESEVESTVHPMDSSSVSGRYNKRYMHPGTVYRVAKGKTVLEPLSEVSPLGLIPDVVGGFQMTESMRKVDIETKQTVYSINGLASPFKNARLNFLCHFHTALKGCQTNSSREPIEALEEISSMRPRNPTEELIKQCINKTFDFEDMSVKSNPFKLPFLEVGMLVTESMLAKCLDLLYNEYKAAWFQEMKCLLVPNFHSEFLNHSTFVSDRERQSGIRRRNEVRHAQRSEESKRGPNARSEKVRRDSHSSRQKSILGFPL
uniref:Nonstructural protein n=1 Tax=Exserohilum turcicum mycobunyavirales-like virus 2 TaxID=3229032 RepID=A0AAU7YC25_9VIRU